MTRRRAEALLALAALTVGVAAGALAVGGSAGPNPPGPVRSPSAGLPAGPSPATAPQLRRIAGHVAAIRQLNFDRLPNPRVLPPAEVADRAAGFLDDYTEAEADADRRVLTALGAIPTGADLRDLLTEALRAQVAGFYDSSSEELVVAADQVEGQLGPLAQMTLAHELDHVLVDQTLGLPPIGRGDEEVPPGKEDAAFAAQALVEGDATLVMQTYTLAVLSSAEQDQLAADAAELAARSQLPADFPHVLRRSLDFPYREGATFVGALHESGGWPGVDRAYDNPPTSTLQILRPRLFLTGRGAGVDPRDPTPPGAGWHRADHLAVGAADLLFLFEAPGDDPTRALNDPLSSATAWRGGEAVLWTRGNATAVGVALEGQPRLCQAMDRWYQAAFADADRRQTEGQVRFDGSDQDAVLSCRGGQVRLGMAPELATAERLTS